MFLPFFVTLMKQWPCIVSQLLRSCFFQESQGTRFMVKFGYGMVEQKRDFMRQSLPILCETFQSLQE